jgi:hypothetical protein
LVEDRVYTLTISIADALGSASSAFYVPPGVGTVAPPAVAEDSGWVSGVVYDSSTCNKHLTACQGLTGTRATLSYAGESSDAITGTVYTGPDGFTATNFEQVEFLPGGDLPPETWETYAFNLGGDSEVSFLQPIPRL